jgi:hypothetical protein
MSEKSVNKMIKTPTLFVATPMYGGMCIGNYTAALMQMPLVVSKAGIKMYYTYMMNESLITRARNSLAYDFLASDATHLMFIDADIGLILMILLKWLSVTWIFAVVCIQRKKFTGNVWLMP